MQSPDAVNVINSQINKHINQGSNIKDSIEIGGGNSSNSSRSLSNESNSEQVTSSLIASGKYGS